MPNNFEVGDVVRCIEGSRLGTLVRGDTYHIIHGDGEYVGVRDADGKGSHGWYHRRFVLKGKPKAKLTGMAQFYKERGM
jgi:hypothetical protein